MNKILLGLSMLVIVFASCTRTISVDTPIVKARKQAVYISTNNNNLISYDANSGAKLWEVITNGTNEGVPVLINEKIYFLTNSGYLYGVNVATGKITLEISLGFSKLPLLTTQPSLCAYQNKLYIANKRIYCYDTLGVQVWNYNPGAFCSTSPTIAEGKLFVGTTKNLHCLDPLNGNFLWSSTAIVELDPADIITSSPRASNGLVYFGADNRKVYALEASNGNTKWTYTAGDKVLSSPMVYGGMCIVGSQDFNVHCIDTTTGLKRWVFPTAERVYSSPIVHELSNTVLVGSYDFNLYAIDHVSGQLKWKYPAGSLIKSSPVVAGNNVYFTAFDRYLYCVDVRNGALVWKQFMNGNSESSPFVDDDFMTGKSAGISGMSKY